VRIFEEFKKKKDLVLLLVLKTSSPLEKEELFLLSSVSTDRSAIAER
jgi:hypothetical protein